MIVKNELLLKVFFNIYNINYLYDVSERLYYFKKRNINYINKIIILYIFFIYFLFIIFINN